MACNDILLWIIERPVDNAGIDRAIGETEERTMDNTKPMMACGHAANATQDGKPCCAICGRDGGPGDASVRIAPAPNLAGRLARCDYCDGFAPSAETLPFFEHLPGRAFDSFYNGCRGWD